ncbi:hypothetical protein, partial [Streptomyces sp. NPDC056492]|uniref:hypothetical protein n=1 Tax=Streptomyces sp. NPDC056492 TaxID=3345838 RepID=UPI0036CD2CA4
MAPPEPAPRTGRAAGRDSGYDVLVLGEVLVEIHAGTALREAADGAPARISYSGDALNVAAAAAAAGARTALGRPAVRRFAKVYALSSSRRDA